MYGQKSIIWEVSELIRKKKDNLGHILENIWCICYWNTNNVKHLWSLLSWFKSWFVLYNWFQHRWFCSYGFKASMDLWPDSILRYICVKRLKIFTNANIVNLQEAGNQIISIFRIFRTAVIRNINRLLDLYFIRVNSSMF